MPSATSREAPRWSSNPDEFDNFFRDVEAYGKKSDMAVRDMAEWAVRYAHPASRRWKGIEAINPVPNDMTWADFKTHVLTLYPDVSSDLTYTNGDLEDLVDEYHSLRHMTTDDRRRYDRKFQDYSAYLISKEKLSTRERNKLYLDGFPRYLQKKIESYMYSLDPSQRREEYSPSDVSKAAKRHMESGGYPRGRSRSRSDSRSGSSSHSRSRSRDRSRDRSSRRNHSGKRSSARYRSRERSSKRHRSRSNDRRRSRDRNSRRTNRGRSRSGERRGRSGRDKKRDRSKAPSPARPAEPQVNELVRLFNRLDTRIDALATRTAPPPVNNQPLVRQQQYQQPAMGVAVQNPARWGPSQNNQTYTQSCMFCGRTDHYVRDCTTAARYIQESRVQRNSEGKLVLPNGDYPSRNLPGRTMKEKVDNWFQNEGIHRDNDQDVAQVHFVETADEVAISIDVSPTTSYRSPSGPSYEDDADFAEQLQICQTQEDSLQETNVFAGAKARKEVFDGVEIKTGPPRPQGRPQPAPQQKTPTILARGQPVPQSLKQPALNPAGKPGARAGASPPIPRPQGPTKPVTMPPKPSAEEAKFRYRAPIDDGGTISKKVVQTMLDTPITLPQGELMAISPSVQKNFKELTTTKRVASHFAEEEDNNPTDNFLTSFDVEEHPREHGTVRFPITSPYAAKKLHLRTVRVDFGSGYEPECVLNGGSQMILIRKDIWKKLNVSLDPNQAVKMEAANSTVNLTNGLVEDYPIRIDNMEVYVQMQVVDDAPYEVLLGRPFFAVYRCSEISASDGDVLLQIVDPTTGRPKVFPTHARKTRHEERAVNFQD